MAAQAGRRYYGRYYEMGWCEALVRAGRAAAHRATSGESAGEAEAAAGRESASDTGLGGDVCCGNTMNVFR